MAQYRCYRLEVSRLKLLSEDSKMSRGTHHIQSFEGTIVSWIGTLESPVSPQELHYAPQTFVEDSALKPTRMGFH